MLPSLAAEPPKGDGWVHEIKHDGHHTIPTLDGGRARAFTRSRLDWSSDYAPLVDAAAELRYTSALVDGEVVAPDECGLFIGFDLMFLDGRDLRGVPLDERRKVLARLLPPSTNALLLFSEDVGDIGPDVFASAERLGLEDIVSKRLGSRYRSGRTDAWRKMKCGVESSLVLTGTDIDKRSGSPIALLARENDGQLRFASGAFFALKADDRQALRDRLARLGWKSTSRSVHPDSGSARLPLGRLTGGAAAH